MKFNLIINYCILIINLYQLLKILDIHVCIMKIFYLIFSVKNRFKIFDKFKIYISIKLMNFYAWKLFELINSKKKK